MAKLYFRYGTMGSAKTLNLLAVAHNYASQGKAVLLLKPKLDTRFGQEAVRSRAGLSRDADYLLEADTDLMALAKTWNNVACLLIDEAQFLSEKNIEELRQISIHQDIPIICYGLRSNYKTRLFEGSKRLMELADTIEELKTTCHYCHRKATMNMKLGASHDFSGPDVILGAEDTFHPACYPCYDDHIRAGRSKEEASTQSEPATQQETTEEMCVSSEA